MTLQLTPASTAAAALLVCASLASTAASAQSWEYKSYKKTGPGGQYEKDRYVTGTITVEETRCGRSDRNQAELPEIRKSRGHGPSGR